MAGSDPEAEPTVTVEELIGLIDRLEGLLERSALSELEVEAGGTALVLRKPGAVAFDPALAGLALAAASGAPAGAPPKGQAAPAAPATTAATGTGFHAVVAPLTGVYYASPSPGAAPYVKVGGQVSAGQVIGLIEAMKLFNEIKSDVTGTVRRIAADNGALVKARQTLIEVEPA
ncbi:MAG: biotin/lipoyl-containing protein [Chloroflexota bacterium]